MERTRRSVPDALVSFAGVQAEDPVSPYIGLWSRLDRFVPSSFEELLASKQIVRGNLMRNTIHAVTPDDFLSWSASLRDMFFRKAKGFYPTLHLERDDVRKVTQALLDRGPASRNEIRDELLRHFPDADPDPLAYAGRASVALVHVPPAGFFRRFGEVRFIDAAQWLGRIGTPAVEDMVVRYLEAFGPASPADFTAWSGISGAAAIFRRLEGLQTYRSPDGKTLFDVAHGRIPTGEEPAPVRFLPSLDNAVLGYANRDRIMPTDAKRFMNIRHPRTSGMVLIDGFVSGRWWLEAKKDAATIALDLAPGTSADALEPEALALAKFLEPSAGSFGCHLTADSAAQ